MFSLHKYPFVRLVVPLAAGIWLAIRYQTNISPTLLSIVLIGLLLVIWLITTYLRRFALRWVFGVVASLMLFIIGYTNVMLRKPDYQPLHFMHIDQPVEFYLARITEPPQQRTKSIRLQLEITEVMLDSGSHRAAGKIVAYLPVSTVGLDYGDLILFQKPPELVSNPLNPHQFDYQRYLSRKGVLHQLFLKEDEWKYAGKGKFNPAYSFAYRLRNSLLESIRNFGLDGDEYHVASAILLGYDEQLPAYLRQSYTAAGGMHVLCVSGLHVGIVYLFFSFLLSFPGKNKQVRTVKTVILIAIVWFYALITGLAPSVIRAATMFSFMLIGQALQRTSYVINTLAASAFLLLWFEPNVLFHIGFQLSYSAVAGIVLLQRPLYNIVYSRFWLIDKAWEAITVTLAAQLAVTPFVLHYFGQFPTYFLITNLILAPLSFIIIVTGMLLLLLSFFPLIATAVGWALSGMIFIMNQAITSIEALPYAVMHYWYLPATASFILAVTIILLYIGASLSWRKIIIPILISFAAFTVYVSHHQWQNRNHSELIVYAVPQHTVMDFIHGNHHILLADTNRFTNSNFLDYYLRNNWLVSGINKPEQIVLPLEDTHYPGFFKRGPYIQFQSKSLTIWQQHEGKLWIPNSPLKVDVVVVAGNTAARLDELLASYSFEHLVFDMSVPPWQLEKWIALAVDAGIRFHNIRTQGAFRLKV